jgi:hypothetical protein
MRFHLLTCYKYKRGVLAERRRAPFAVDVFPSVCYNTQFEKVTGFMDNINSRTFLKKPSFANCYQCAYLASISFCSYSNAAWSHPKSCCIPLIEKRKVSVTGTRKQGGGVCSVGNTHRTATPTNASR